MSWLCTIGFHRWHYFNGERSAWKRCTRIGCGACRVTFTQHREEEEDA